MGCIMMRKCHTNTCPVGIATQARPRLLGAGPRAGRGPRRGRLQRRAALRPALRQPSTRGFFSVKLHSYAPVCFTLPTHPPTRS